MGENLVRIESRFVVYTETEMSNKLKQYFQKQKTPNQNKLNMQYYSDVQHMYNFLSFQSNFDSEIRDSD